MVCRRRGVGLGRGFLNEDEEAWDSELESDEALVRMAVEAGAVRSARGNLPPMADS